MKYKVRTLEPLHDRVVVRREADEAEPHEESYIAEPENTKEAPSEGLVIWVGTGKLLENGTVIPVKVKPSDRVLFGKFAGQDVKIGDTEYVILREDEILGVLKVEEIEIADSPNSDPGSQS